MTCLDQSLHAESASRGEHVSFEEFASQFVSSWADSVHRTRDDLCQGFLRSGLGSGSKTRPVLQILAVWFGNVWILV